MKAHCVGMVICDVVISDIRDDFRFEAEPIIYYVDSAQNIGGDAGNVTIGLAKMGVDVSVSTVLGQDITASFVLKEFEEKGVDTSGIVQLQGAASALSYIMISRSGKRSYLTGINIFDELDATHISDDSLKDVDLVYFGSAFTFEKMDRGGIADLFKRAKQYGAVTVLDSCLARANLDAPVERECLLETLNYTDIFLPSLEEAQFAFATDDPRQMARQIKHKNLKIFGVKMGTKGSYITDFKNEYNLGIYTPPVVVDQTGAGDAYVSGFIRAYLEGETVRCCAKIASANASFNVQKKGATGGVQKFEDLKRFTEQNTLEVFVNEYK